MTHLFTEHDDFDSLTKRYSYQDGKLIEHAVQDVQPSLDRNARLRNAPEYAREGIRNEFQHVAHIDAVVVLKWINEHGFDATTAHPREIARFIERHPEYHYVKTTDGRIAR
ncbi:MAG: hypothetical protein LT106_18585 [Burkholderiaceae bacterium]|nr:hypothetical protein [Burkholderiaceae bacterium]